MQQRRRLSRQIQPQSAGGPLQTPVLPGVPLLKDPRQVLRGDADARVRNVQAVTLQPDGNASLRGVLDGVGEQLLQNTHKPLPVRHHRPLRGLIVKAQLSQYKLRPIPPHGLPYQLIQIAPGNDQIVLAPVQPQVLQHHVHILLHAE